MATKKMLQEIIMYHVVCDRCGADAQEGSEYAGYTDKSWAILEAEMHDFQQLEDKYFCQACWEYDPNGEDKAVAKEPIPETPNNANLTKVASEFTTWSLQTLSEATAQLSIDKLKEEIKETEEELAKGESSPSIGLEYVDCLMCIFDSAARKGITPAMLTELFAEKLEYNKRSKWQRSVDGIYSRIKP